MINPFLAKNVLPFVENKKTNLFTFKLKNYGI